MVLGLDWKKTPIQRIAVSHLVIPEVIFKWTGTWFYPNIGWMVAKSCSTKRRFPMLPTHQKKMGKTPRVIGFQYVSIMCLLGFFFPWSIGLQPSATAGLDRFQFLDRHLDFGGHHGHEQKFIDFLRDKIYAQQIATRKKMAKKLQLKSSNDMLLICLYPRYFYLLKTLP